MDETPSDLPSRTPRALISSEDDSDAAGTNGRPRLVAWLVGVIGLTAAVVVALVAFLPGASKQEKAAIRTAVVRYADLFHEPTQKIYKFNKIRARRLEDGGYRVSITRVIVPDPVNGYGITSYFKVDRNGVCTYVGQVEDLGR